MPAASISTCLAASPLVDLFFFGGRIGEVERKRRRAVKFTRRSNLAGRRGFRNQTPRRRQQSCRFFGRWRQARKLCQIALLKQFAYRLEVLLVEAFPLVERAHELGRGAACGRKVEATLR